MAPSRSTIDRGYPSTTIVRFAGADPCWRYTAVPGFEVASDARPSEGIGRPEGLKSLCPKGRAGSNPASGTKEAARWLVRGGEDRTHLRPGEHLGVQTRFPIRSLRLGKRLPACGIRGSSPIKCYVLGVAMHRSIRFLALATLAIGVIALPMVLPGSSAYAKSKSKTGVTVKCTALSGIFIAPLPETLIISGCSQTQATGGTGTLSCPENGFCPPGLVTWSNRLGTTTLKFGQRTIFAGDPKNKCPNANDTEEIWKGGGTRSSPAGRSPGVSGSVSAKVCVEPLSPGSTAAVFSLVPGSRFKL